MTHWSVATAFGRRGTGAGQWFQEHVQLARHVPDLDKGQARARLGMAHQGAEIAQLVEQQLPKLWVAGSNPVFRSIAVSVAA